MSEQNISKSPVWATVCIKLLQSPIYRMDSNDAIWSLLQTWQSDIDRYFYTIGLHVFVDFADGYAFLEQRDMGEEEDSLPKLIIERPLTIQDSLLCVLFREALDQFDTSQNQSVNLVMTRSEIKDRLDTFFAEKKDQTKVFKRLDESLNRLKELTFIKEIETSSSSQIDRTFEIRRILKAKVNAEFISEFREKLKTVLDEGEVEKYDL